MTTRHTRAQISAIMDRTDELMTEAAGRNPLSGCIPVQKTYTRQRIMDRLNAADDAIQGSHQYENSESIRDADTANLSVNITGWLLDHPDRIADATIEEIITDQYSTDPEEVLGWVR
jgi:hypothetical protein